MTHAIDRFLALPAWRSGGLERLVPLADAIRVEQHAAGTILFRQFHPADRFALLVSGAAAHETGDDVDGESWPMGHIDWPWAALGWSSFLPPFRYGTSARALTPVELLTWSREDLDRVFYADPSLAIDFLQLVLDSMRCQFEALRNERLASSGAQTGRAVRSHSHGPAPHRFAPGLLTTLRRSAFFQLFEDADLRRLTASARMVRHQADRQVLHQNQALDGLWVLASGNAISCFAASYRDGQRLLPFRSIAGDGGVVAGIPALDGRYVAEASVLTESVCYFYEIPAVALSDMMHDDPEFGRSFMQRHLVRLAHLMTAARLPRPDADQEHEVSAVQSLLNQNQARIPVNSDLYKLPHLLGHRLTTGNAFACLNSVAATGRYEERAVARGCRDLLHGWYREHHFYRDLLEAYMEVVDAPVDVAAETLRAQCDAKLSQAFSHLDTEIHNIGHLPATRGNIIVMNHLACPPYYELPNHYHFSFDTAFVSVLLTARYGIPPVRVVRQSPGAEYGHNLFYSRLGHITVPTVESGLDILDTTELDALRRQAGAMLLQRGREALAAGDDVLICPEGQSQKAADSPARFFSGAFRLALQTRPEPLIVPIAVAGFERRYKDSRLVAMVQEPFRLSDAMRAAGTDDLRCFVDGLREEFRLAVTAAQQISTGHALITATPAESSAPQYQ